MELIHLFKKEYFGMARIPKPSGRRSRKTILVSYGVHLV